MKHYHNLHLLAYVSWVTIGLTTFLMGLIIYWLFYPYKPVAFTSKFVEYPAEVKQGDYIYYSFNYCKYTDREPQVKREFINGIIFQSADTRAKVETGCGKAIVKQKIPEELPAGTYVFRTTVTYKMNPVRSVTYSNQTNSFKVIVKE